MNIRSKFPKQETTIFTVMSALAKEFEAINLSQGFPNFEPDPDLLEELNSAMRNGYNQYAPMPGHLGLREILAEKHLKSSGRALNPASEITITAGATQAIYTSITSLVHKGDEVIYFEPAYDCYRPAVESVGGVVIGLALEAPDFKVDWELLSSMISSKTRMIIVNTPNNPGCFTWKKSDWENLERLILDKDIIVLSDEVYEHLVFDPEGHQSVLSRPALAKQSLACFSFGKNFHVTGWKLGYVAGDEQLMNEFRQLHQYTVFAVHHPSQQALYEYMQDPSTYQNLGPFYKEKYETFIKASKGSRFNFLPSEGSFFVLADYSKISDLTDKEFAVWMTKEHGIASIPLSPFYKEAPLDQRLVRFCFAKTVDLLQEAGEKLRII